MENPHRILYGHLSGFRLSELGRAQSAAVGRRLQAEAIGLIVHSPLERAKETAEIIAGELTPRPALEVDPRLVEAEFSRYLQGVPYWQIPVRRPLWLVHKARRGLLPGDEAIEQLGGRVVDLVHRVARQHPEEASLLVSHADPLMAAWVLLDGRPQTERELTRKPVDRAGLLEVDVEGGRVLAVNYVPPPAPAPSDGRQTVSPPAS